MLATGSLSLFVAIADLKPYVHLQLVPHMTKYHQVRLHARVVWLRYLEADYRTLTSFQYWRLLIYPFAFTNSVEVLMALLAFYHMGVHVERHVLGPKPSFLNPLTFVFFPDHLGPANTLCVFATEWSCFDEILTDAI
jgi:hypothetical protein